MSDMVNHSQQKGGIVHYEYHAVYFQERLEFCSAPKNALLDQNAIQMLIHARPPKVVLLLTVIYLAPWE